MGILSFFKRKKVVGKKAVPASDTNGHTRSTSNAGTPTGQASTPTAASSQTTTSGGATPQTESRTPGTSGKPRSTASSATTCAAITAAGTPCKSASRPNSKYCGRHKGYRASGKAPATAGRSSTPSKSKATKPASRAKPADRTGATRASTRSGNAARRQITHGDYRLYQSGNRHYFSKKAQNEVGAGVKPVYEMPSGRVVVETPNGLPVLKKQ